MDTHNREDIFSADKTPEMVKELSVLKQETAHTPIYFKAEIIISYLKSHSLKNDWIEANPKLTKLMTANSFATTHLESLFAYCRNNLPFQRGYEKYLRNKILMLD